MFNGGLATSIYIHIPFCKTKCPYCDFASWAGKENLIDKYFEALITEVRTKCEAYRNEPANRRDDQLVASTIFIGGGTPSLIHPDYYEKLFTELKKYFVINNDCEITLELNPETAREDYVKGYKKLGVNRISIGAQSFNENILKILERSHLVEDIVYAINVVKEAGINNFNLDLIYAVPHMTKEIWTESIYKTLELKPKHISAYPLTIEKNSNLLPKDDFTFELYSDLCKILKPNGYIHYEISNFAKPEFESKHNLTYWQAKEYYSFGANAHRYINGLRTRNLRDLESYISYPNREIILDYPIDYTFEKIMLMSRLKEGFEVNLLKRSNPKIKALLKELSKENFIELSGQKIHLTDKGMFINNEILLRLI
ncbi:MAG: radical SAM family heme chaperone HemW [Candidatus Melainabacteria bacterium]|nr:radical SAM family heme chaperone HemW [Candidatus Melainabacteria bacterium]